MRHYQAYGVALSSAVRLPELRALSSAPSAASTSVLSIVVTHEPIAPAGWDVQPRSDEQSEVWLRVAVARGGGVYWLHFANAGDFLLDPVTRTITIISPEGAHLQDGCRHLLIDQVIPLALAHGGALVVHASACAVGDGAVAFVGPAGAGKSTLAASLALRGYPLLADDALVVEPAASADGSGWMALPAYAGARVWPDVVDGLVGSRRLAAVGAYTDKRRLTPSDGLSTIDTPLRLRRVYRLEPCDGAGVEIRALAPRDAIMTLISHAFVLDVADRQRLTAHFSRAFGAAPAVGLRSLSYAHDLINVEDVLKAVLADLHS